MGELRVRDIITDDIGREKTNPKSTQFQADIISERLILYLMYVELALNFFDMYMYMYVCVHVSILNYVATL